MRSRIALLLFAFGCVAATACGAVPAASGPPGSGSRAVIVSDMDSARTVTLHVGDHLSVALHGTYWTFAASSNSSVLRAAGAPTLSPPASRCVPGQGCGTVTAAFTAVTAGTAVIDASRVVCGEALQCAPADRSYSLKVIVQAG